MKWTSLGEREESKGEELLPSPRHSTASCFIDGKVYIFGGHQGYGEERKSLDDFWSFDIGTSAWHKVEYKNSPCKSRGGHSIFAVGTKIYIYGG